MQLQLYKKTIQAKRSISGGAAVRKLRKIDKKTLC